MGYETRFKGNILFNKRLLPEQIEYINKFSDSRRVIRDVDKLMELYDGKKGLVGTSKSKNTPLEIYGQDGGYFVDGCSSNNDQTTIDFNTPPGQKGFHIMDYNDSQKKIDAGECQPGLWCQWIIKTNNEGDEPFEELVWDGNEKFSEYTDWMKYLIEHFFKPWNLVLNGEIKWKGEEFDDEGTIVVTDNIVTEIK